jgi:antiviral helicase SKI2
MRRKQDKEREAAGLPPVQRTGGRGGAPVTKARELPTGRSAPFTKIGAGRNHSNRGGGQGAPSPAPGAASRGGGPGGGRGGRGGAGGGFGPSRPSFQLDQNVWTHLIGHLKKATATLSKMDLCDAKDKSEVHVTWERALNRLKRE